MKKFLLALIAISLFAVSVSAQDLKGSVAGVSEISVQGWKSKSREEQKKTMKSRYNKRGKVGNNIVDVKEKDSSRYEKRQNKIRRYKIKQGESGKKTSSSTEKKKRMNKRRKRTSNMTSEARSKRVERIKEYKNSKTDEGYREGRGDSKLEKMRERRHERRGDRKEKKEYRNSERDEGYREGQPEMSGDLHPKHRGRGPMPHEIMSKLTPEQRDHLKQEIERHHKAMKEITGLEMQPGRREKY